MSFTKFVKVITNQSPSGLFSYRIYKELLVPKEKEKILNDYKQEYISREYISKFYPEVVLND